MPGITSAGVGSGLPLEQIITASVEAEDLPKLERFKKQEARLDLQLTALGQMKSDLSAFDTTLDILTDISSFEKRSATLTQPSDGDVISVTTTSSATAGKFDISVEALAQGSRAVQDDANSYSATTDVVSASGGVLSFGAGAKTFDVTVAAGATLEELRTAINDAADNFGISANIINTGGATPMSKLVFTSDETGSGNDLIVTNDIAELDKVSTLANGGGAGGMNIAAGDVAQDAHIKIDGIDSYSSNNTFTNSIQDSTITVLKESPLSDPTDPLSSKATANLDISTDEAFVKETLEKFVESFNKIISTLNTVVDSKSADATARGLRNALIKQVGTFVAGAGDLQTVYDIGIGLEKGGRLEIKSTAVTTLDEALTDSYDDIGALFAGSGGVAETLSNTVKLYLDGGGIIKSQQDDLEQQKSSLEDSRENHAYRMEQFESRLRKQYTGLDVLMASLQSQGSAITASLNSLPGFVKQNN